MHRILLVLVAAVVACNEARDTAGGEPRRSRRVEIGQAVPSYGATLLRGDADSLVALRGKVVMLNVWATWCIPCRTELPDLEALHQRYSPDGLTIVGVSIDESGAANDVLSYATERGVTFTLWHDPADRVSGVFLANGVPATYLIGRDGTLRWRWMGPLSKDDKALQQTLEQALAEPAS